MEYIYKWKIIQSLKGRKILTYATIWMIFEDNIPSEISQSQKDKYSMITLT